MSDSSFNPFDIPEDITDGNYDDAYERGVAAGIKYATTVERERCAQIAEAKAKWTDFLVVDGNEFRRGARLTAYGIAAAIRAVPANTNTEETS